MQLTVALRMLNTYEKSESNHKFEMLGLRLSSLKNIFIHLNAEVCKTNFAGFKEHHCSFRLSWIKQSLIRKTRNLKIIKRATMQSY